MGKKSTSKLRRKEAMVNAMLTGEAQRYRNARGEIRFISEDGREYPAESQYKQNKLSRGPKRNSSQDDFSHRNGSVTKRGKEKWPRQKNMHK